MAALGRIPSKWENFEVALEAFNDMIEDQRQALKAKVADDIEICRKDLGAFRGRWETLRPREITKWDDSAVEEIFENIAEWKVELDALAKTAATLKASCDHFDVPAPTFEGLEDLESEFNATEAEWSQLKKFNSELGELKRRDWISFRASVFEAEDLARAWLDSMKGKARGEVLDHIAEVCGGIRKSIPALKFMRGEPFKEEHWQSLMRKLGMPKGTSIQNLTFGHFVDVIDNVAENLQFAKEMTSRAQGEVTIREAILELKAWSETAGINMLEHTEMGRMTPLIKDWKDLLLELATTNLSLAL